MSSQALVQLALDRLSCSQRELANRVEVSPTQISKWKNGDHMSGDMEAKFRAITNIGDRDPDFVFWTGSLEDADKWERLIRYLANVARENEETGYDTYLLGDDEPNTDVLVFYTLRALREMGVEIAIPFPDELDFDYEADMTDEQYELVFTKNPYSSLIYRIFISLNNVWGFYEAYISELIFNDELDLADDIGGMDELLFNLAACKAEVADTFAPKVSEFRRQTFWECAKWITNIKERAIRAQVPLRAELMDLLNGAHEDLGEQAEAESLGYNQARVHPDIYMNELLVGMRRIQQLLPAITAKLGIETQSS